MSAIDKDKIPVHSFDWGVIKWHVTPDTVPGASFDFGEVILFPGEGHTRHNHPTSEEVLYVLSGQGEQIVDDGKPFPVSAGDTIYIGKAVFHSTMNTGWEPLRLLALYANGGETKGLAGLPDFRELPAGDVQKLSRR